MLNKKKKMKKISELKLNQLSKTELEKKQMISIKGGEECNCTCDSGLTYGMTNVQGYQEHKCDGVSCSCQCTADNDLNLDQSNSADPRQQ
jgi:natural product precursor